MSKQVISQVEVEFERQVGNLVDKGYPQLAGMTEEAFVSLLSPLKEKLVEIKEFKVDVEQGVLPFVIVLKSSLIPAEEMMAKVEREGKSGVTKLNPHQAYEFQILEKVVLPEGEVYLLVDIDRGKETLNVTPEEAFRFIEEDGRSPLTIEEGIALVTHFPEFLIKNNCFSLLASRKAKSQSVPAVWINGNKQPNLGWCWDRNPHTWLGSASAKKRLR